MNPFPGSVTVRGGAACRAALVDERLVSDPSLVGLGSRPPANMLFMDGPVHLELRHAVVSALAPAKVADVIERMRPSIRLRSDVVERSQVIDLVPELLTPLVAEFALRLAGVPDASIASLSAQTIPARGLLDTMVGPDARVASMTILHLATAMSRAYAAAGTASSLGDRISHLSQAQQRMAPAVFVHGGFENPLNHLGLRLAALAAHRGEAGASAPDESFLESVSRAGPVRKVLRWSVEPVASLGIGRGAAVWIELEDDRPDDLGVPSNLLGFGHGAHRCPGQAAARQLSDALLPVLAGPVGRSSTVRVEQHDGWLAKEVRSVVLSAGSGTDAETGARA
jgi:cytochrome P450